MFLSILLAIHTPHTYMSLDPGVGSVSSTLLSILNVHCSSINVDVFVVVRWWVVLTSWILLPSVGGAGGAAIAVHRRYLRRRRSHDVCILFVLTLPIDVLVVCLVRPCFLHIGDTTMNDLSGTYWHDTVSMYSLGNLNIASTDWITHLMKAIRRQCRINEHFQISTLRYLVFTFTVWVDKVEVY